MLCGSTTKKEKGGSCRPCQCSFLWSEERVPPPITLRQFLNGINIDAEEVAVKNHRYAHEQICVDGGALEDLVHIGPVAEKLARQPTDRTLLALHLLLDKFAYIYLGHSLLTL